MWTICGIVALALVCAGIDLPSLAAYKKDKRIFLLLLSFATALGIAAAMKAHIPNPLDWIAAVFEQPGRWLQSLFE